LDILIRNESLRFVRKVDEAKAKKKSTTSKYAGLTKRIGGGGGRGRLDASEAGYNAGA